MGHCFNWYAQGKSVSRSRDTDIPLADLFVLIYRFGSDALFDVLVVLFVTHLGGCIKLRITADF